jgi:MFS family permease
MGDQATRRVVNRLFLAEAVSRVGDAVTMVALPLTAVLVLDASPAELALIGAAQAMPILVLSLPGGAWVDRRARRWPILITADLGRAALLAAIPATAMAGTLSLGLLAAVAAACSALGTLFDLSFAGWVPRLVSGDALHRANARIELARSAAGMVGPALGGFLVAALSAPLALLADAASFAGSAVFVASVHRHEPAQRPGSPPGPIAHELLAGIGFIRRQPLVRAVTLTAGINNLTRSIAMGVAVLYLVDFAGLGAAQVGVAFAVGQAGFVVGALLARRVTSRLGMGLTMQLGVTLFGPSMVAFALAPPALAGVAFSCMIFAQGFGIAIHNVNQVTVRQVLTPDWLRARVAAVTRLVVFGAIPMGTLIGGLIGEAWGVQTALLVGGLGLFAGPLPYLVVRVTRLRRVEELNPA